MRDFRFRAAPALELRRQQESAAGAALAKAEARFREAQSHVAAGEAQRHQAQNTAQDEARRGTHAAALDWHRNWIVRLTATVDRLRADAEVRAAAVREAESAWRHARRRRLALERMRDRAWRRFEQEQRRREIKVIDELARMRHLIGDGFNERNES